MKLVVGLGNPGEKYSKNRHNVGFLVLDAVVKEKELRWNFDSKLKAEVSKYKSQVSEILFVKPQTFMNNSGESISQIVKFYKIDTQGITVIHDDIDLLFGDIKYQTNVGSAGHNGVQSLINHLGTQDFKRVRIGVGRPSNIKIDIEDWVLMNFSDLELEKILEVAKKVGTTL